MQEGQLCYSKEIEQDRIEKEGEGRWKGESHQSHLCQW